MAGQPAQAAVEAGVAVLLVAVAALVLAGTRDIAPALYDPLGSAAMPRAAAGLVVVLALAMLWRAVARLRAESGLRAGGGRPPEPVAGRNGLAAAFLASTVAYAGVMQAGWLGYRDATLLFFVVTGLTLARGRRHLVLPILVIAAVIGVGGHYLFTRLFYVALP